MTPDLGRWHVGQVRSGDPRRPAPGRVFMARATDLWEHLDVIPFPFLPRARARGPEPSGVLCVRVRVHRGHCSLAGAFGPLGHWVGSEFMISSK